MMPGHYNLEDLLAFLERNEGGDSVSRHLSACPECRDRLRQLIELRRAASGMTGHPGQDDLLAYQSGALGLEVIGQIRDHLRDCPACRDALKVVEWRETQEPEPPPALKNRLARLFHERFARKPGRLVITLTGGLTARWAEEKRGDFLQESALYCICPAHWEESIPLELFIPFEPEIERTPPVHVENEEFDISLVIRQDGTDLFFEVFLVSKVTGHPAEGIPLRLIPASGDPLIFATDQQGKAGFRVRPPKALLLIEGPTPFEIPIEIEDRV